MKKTNFFKALLIFFPLTLLSHSAIAFDFAATTPTGQVLYYNALSDSTVAVTFPNQMGDSYYAGYTMPSGNLLIPSTVSHLATTYKVVAIGSHALHGCPALTGVIIPNTVQSIQDYSFYSCTNLFSVHIPSGVLAISDYAFSNCMALTNLILPESVTVLGMGVFQGCGLLNSVRLSNQLTAIGSLAFEGCSSLTAIDIPNSVVLLGSWVFGNCTNLDSVSIGSHVSFIQSNVFSGCNHVRYLRYDCSSSAIQPNPSIATLPVANLCQLDIGDSVVALPSYAFVGASHLKEIYLGVSLDTIASFAFSGCDSLRQIKIRRLVPPVLDSTSFPNYSAELVIPCESQVTYQSASNWSNFDSISDFFPYSATSAANNILWGSTAVTQLPSCANPYVQVQAYANAGFHFLKWTDGIQDNPRSEHMTSDKLFTAQFVSDYSNIRVLSCDTMIGSVSGSGIYLYQAPATIEATPRNGYHFVSWNDGVINNPRTISVCQDSTFSAQFAPNTYYIYTSANDVQMGTTSGTGAYEFSSWVEISAQPNDGYYFVQWSDGVTDNPRIVQVTCDSTVNAIFAPYSYSISVISNDTLLGSVIGSGVFSYNATVQIEAVPAPHCSFLRWDDGNIDNPRTVIVESDSTYSAIFAPVYYQVAALSNDSAMGYVLGSGNYRFDENVILQAVADEHCYFTSWSDGETANPRVVSVSSDTLFVAEFSANSQFEISVVSNNPDYGVVNGSGFYYYSDTAVISAVPQGDHIEFYSWDDGCRSNPRTIRVVGDATYTALFGPEMIPFTVTSNDDALGLVYGGGTYPYGTRVTALAVPAIDSRFINWSDGVVDNPRTLVLTDPITLQANFIYSCDYLDTEVPDQSFYSMSVVHLQLQISASTDNLISVYDLQGRRLVQTTSSHIKFQLPHPGAYLVQVGHESPHKIIAY